MTDDTTVVAGAEGASDKGAGEPWYKGADTETLGYLQNRGLDKKTAAEVAFESIKAHREATAKLGVPADQLIRMPKDAADEAGQKALYERLGKPADDKGYDFKEIEAVDANKPFAEFMRKSAFAQNLTKAQAEGLAKDLAKFANDTQTSANADQEAAITIERDALKKDWGFNFQANTVIARNAAQKLGIEPKAIEGLEKVAGYRATMEALRKIGVAIGEAKFVTSEVTGSVMTRDGAVARKAELMRDTAWTAKYLAGDVQAGREMTNLNTIIVGGQS